MIEIEAAGRKLPMRKDLHAAIEDAWKRLAAPGTWWSGEERIAIAAEVRQSHHCRLCQRRKQALSPYTVEGVHETVTSILPADAIEATHRLATDSGRVTEAWVRSIADGPLGEESYVEIISIVAIVTALDTLDKALGRPQRALPASTSGQPTRQRPQSAKRDVAWVAMLSPDQMAPDDLNPFSVHGDKNIHRGLSLVPQEVMNFFDLDVELYLRDHEIRDFENEHRAISHAQIELIAARASAINACFY